jgi:hypothetical protein
MSVRVRDLEIALVLAREMKAAAARSVDASLRLDQLQEVFGVEHLDRAERARIQTALQMAGLEPFPSLLEADPAEPIRFGAAKAAAGAATTVGGGGGDTAPPLDPAPEPPADASQTFPTVGQFARSKLGRSRRFGARRGDHGGRGARAGQPEPEPAPDQEVEAEREAYLDGGTLADELAEAEPEAAEPKVTEPEAAEPEVTEQEQLEPSVAAAEAEPEVAELDPEPDVPEPAPESEATWTEAEPELHDPEDEREYIPLVAPEDVAPAEVYAPPEAYAAPDAYAVAPEVRSPARDGDLVAALLPAVAIPVIVTSIAGWRFGLPFVALSVIATGIVMGRRPHDGEPRLGLVATLRGSRAAATVLKMTVIVTAVSVVASVVLASVGKDSSSPGGHSAVTPSGKRRPSAATGPSSPTRPATKRKHRRKSKRHATIRPSDPATQGLVRVPPHSSVPSRGTGPNGTGTGTGSNGTGTGTPGGTGAARPSTPRTGTPTQPSSPAPHSGTGTGAGPGAGTPQRTP